MTHFAANSTQEEPLPPSFVIRLSCIDYYMSEPTSPFGLRAGGAFPGRRQRPQPVIRLWGPIVEADEGVLPKWISPLDDCVSRKACVHVRGILPYFFVRLDSSLVGADPVVFMGVLRRQLEGALQAEREMSKRKQEPGVGLEEEEEDEGGGGDDDYFGGGGGRRKRGREAVSEVHSVELISGFPYFGFHGDPSDIACAASLDSGQDHARATKETPLRGGRELFACVRLFDPRRVAVASGLFLSGAVVPGRRLQPYESHVGFVLQFAMDHGLAGMDLCRICSPRWRRPAEDKVEVCVGKVVGSGPKALWSSCSAGSGRVEFPPVQDIVAATAAMSADEEGENVSRYVRSSVTALECDANAARGQVRSLGLQARGVRAAGRELAETFSCVPSLAVLWAEETDRARSMNMTPPQLPVRVHSAEPSSNSLGGGPPEASLERESRPQMRGFGPCVGPPFGREFVGEYAATSLDRLGRAVVAASEHDKERPPQQHPDIHRGCRPVELLSPGLNPEARAGLGAQSNPSPPVSQDVLPIGSDTGFAWGAPNPASPQSSSTSPSKQIQSPTSPRQRGARVPQQSRPKTSLERSLTLEALLELSQLEFSQRADNDQPLDQRANQNDDQTSLPSSTSSIDDDMQEEDDQRDFEEEDHEDILRGERSSDNVLPPKKVEEEQQVDILRGERSSDIALPHQNTIVEATNELSFPNPRFAENSTPSPPLAPSNVTPLSPARSLVSIPAGKRGAPSTQSPGGLLYLAQRSRAVPASSVLDVVDEKEEIDRPKDSLAVESNSEAPSTATASGVKELGTVLLKLAEVQVPGRDRVQDSLLTFGLAPVRHREPYFSEESDLPARPPVLVERVWYLPGTGIRFLQPFETASLRRLYPGGPGTLVGEEIQPLHVGTHRLPRVSRDRAILLAPSRDAVAPSRASVEKWLEEEKEILAGKEQERDVPVSRFDGNTGAMLGAAAARADAVEKRTREEMARKMEDVSGTRSSDRVVGAKPEERTRGLVSSPETAATNQHLTILSIEVAALSAGDLLPNPLHDPIVAVAWTVQDDDLVDRWGFQGGGVSDGSGLVSGVIVVDALGAAKGRDETEEVEGERKKSRVDLEGLSSNPPQNTTPPPSHHSGLPGPFSKREYPPPPLGATSKKKSSWRPAVEVWRVSDEVELFAAVVWLVRRWDPDILVGFEVQRDSLGMLEERAKVLGLESFTRMISRAPVGPDHPQNGNDKWGRREGSGMWVIGRHVLNLWRQMQSEVKLARYSLSHICQAVLRRRIPEYEARTMTRWLIGSGNWPLTEATDVVEKRSSIGREMEEEEEPGDREPRTWADPSLARDAHRKAILASKIVRIPPLAATHGKALEHLLDLSELNLALMDGIDLIGRTSEMARLFGIEFFAVMNRGSQFRVEAVMLRAARARGFIAPSPSRQQVASQAAMEVQPMILEPHSRIYTSPVAVLDFQSLYPSLIIAYNMCFCTVLGRLPPGAAMETPPPPSEHWSPAVPWLRRRLGFCEYSPPPRALHRAVKQGAFVSTNGTIFAPRGVREGVLPRMLREILETRVMIKTAMKRTTPEADPVLHRVRHARQFALKMLSNVTYGYTAAGYSGRMPCAEIADAIVQTARDTLLRTIRLTDSHPAWRARVVYGDTDSLFAVLPQRTVRAAFAIGEAVASHVTSGNPEPVRLKLEKIYHPAALVSKKRYCGRIFESPPTTDLTDDIEGVPLDVKGLEIVRRDSCGLTQRVMREVVEELFFSRDLSKCRRRLEHEWKRLLEGRAPLDELVFARECRLGRYSSRGPPPPQAVVAQAMLSADPRQEPRYAERVPFVVCSGKPNARLVDNVHHPLAVLRRPSELRPNAEYYIRKQIIPSLHRVLSLCGADIRAWYDRMPRPAPRWIRSDGSAAASRTLEAHYARLHCLVCSTPCPRRSRSGPTLCSVCASDPRASLLALLRQASNTDKRAAQLWEACFLCTAHRPPAGEELPAANACVSLACSILFQRQAVALDQSQAAAAVTLFQDEF